VNIEKTFIEKITHDFPGSSELIYHMLENNLLNFSVMQKYLIKKEYDKVISEGKQIPKMILYCDLSEKYHMSIDRIRFITHNY
jgi:hypothetical protein